MAMFLSRIKKALNLGTKSITQNGTYNASSDGYDGYSSVEVNVAGVTPTPITPSNSSPAQMTANTPVSPTANGYAIESYSTVTPQEGIANQLVSGSFVKMNGSGYGIKDFTQITPSNAVPVSLSSNKFYKPSASGYAISSYSSKTPSDSSPASVSSGAIIKASAAGYLYSKVQPKMGLAPDLVKEYSNMANNATQTFSVTQKPRYITFFFTYYASTKGGMFLVLDVLSSKAYRYGYWGSSFHNEDYSSSYSSYITSVSSSSVTVKNSWGGAGNVAVGVYY